jgi:membrane protease YdiL (CAAX protease family)
LHRSGSRAEFDFTTVDHEGRNFVAQEQLTGSEKRALLLWVLLGIVGVWFAHRYFFRAFPEAAVNFRVSRSEALLQAKRFLGGLGENVGAYRSSVVFSVDDDAKTYLEREIGLQQTNQLLSSELNIWYWQVRFFRPKQEEEFYVRVSPGGKVVGYEHQVEEARAAGTLNHEQAQATAQTFLIKTLGTDLSGWDFLPEEANSEKKPNRLDWSFTWQKRGFRAKDAPYRLKVGVDGDRVGGTREYLQVPEEWTRSYKRLRSGNDTLALAFTIPYVLLLVAAVWLGVKLTNRGQTTWRAAMLLGVVVASLLFLQNLNDWPLWSASYDTNSSYAIFVALKIGLAVLIALGSAITITLVLPAAEPLYRASQPDRLQLGKILSVPALRSKEFFSAAVVGLSLAAAHIGYVVGFYVIASHFGAWAPQELNYQDSVNTAFPWISGAAIGLLASTNEEFTFRLFAIPFFARLTKSRWIAVILPAFLWSFLHSNYPQEPAYIRGIEIGLVGMVAGLVMLRWGILATLIWHYTVDASLVGLFLVRSNSLYFKVSGAVVAAAAVAPLLFAGISYLARGRFESDEGLLNRALPAPDLSLAGGAAESGKPFATLRYDALSPAAIAFLAVCLVGGGLAMWRLKPAAIGDYLKFTVDTRSATRNADAILRARNVAPDSYHHVAVLVNTTDPVINEFLRERGGIEHLNEIYANEVPGELWRVRYFRDSQPEEYAVVLKPDGALHAVHHTVAEAAAGASLSKEDARGRGEKFLSEEKKVDLSQWSLVETKSEKQPNRTDHTLTWQENAPLDRATGTVADSAGHAHARMELVVQGDEVTNYRTYIKVPDEWRRKQEEMTVVRAIFQLGIPILVFGGWAIWVIIPFLRNLRSEVARSIPWKRLAVWASWTLVAYVVVFVCGKAWASAMSAYNTAIPYKTMVAIVGIGALLGGPLNFGFLLLVFGMAWYYAKRAFGEERLPGWSGMPGAYYRDAVWIGLGGAAGLTGLQTLLQTAAQRWPTAHRVAEAAYGTDFDTVLPGAATVAGTVQHSLLLTGFVALMASFVAVQVRQAWLRWLLFVLVSLALVGGGWGSAGDFAKQWIAQMITLGVLVIGIARLMRFNVLGCFLAVFSMSLATDAGEFVGQPERFYRLNGYAMIAVVGIAVILPLMAWRMRPELAGNGQVGSAG